MDEQFSVGAWLKQRRRALNLTQAELARQVGCATITLQKIELDERRPSIDIAERLAEVLQIVPEERAAFLKSARGELAADHLPVSSVTEPAPHWRAAPRPATNLPIALTSLIGREHESAAVSALLHDRGVRLVTLTGPGGTGKTRLALQLAANLLDQFPDGVWLVELAPMHDPILVPAAIGAVFGMSDTGGQPLTERLSAFLQSKHRLLARPPNESHRITLYLSRTEQARRT